MTPAGTSNELNVQNEWEEKTHTHITNLEMFVLVYNAQNGPEILLCTVADSARGLLNREELQVICLVGEKPDKELPGMVGARGDTVEDRG